MKFITFLSITVMTLFNVSCGSSGDDPVDQSDEMGTMSLRITDAPIDSASEVRVQFSQVQIRGMDSSQNLDFVLDPPKSFDLLTLQGSGNEALFIDEAVPAGTYEEVRLIIDAESGVVDSYIVLESGGEQHELTVPSGSQSGLKVKGGFVVPANGSADFTIDFDVRKSIVQSGNANSQNGVKYHLKPVLRMVDNTKVGHISGMVDAALLTQAAGCSDDDVYSYNAVYVFAGADVIADDIDTDETTVEPVTTALLHYDPLTDTHSYEIAYLNAGDYTVSFTCNADLEVIEEDNDLLFKGSQNVIVESGQTAVADFM